MSKLTRNDLFPRKGLAKMPYGEKLNSIKKDRGLTNAKISTICEVPLSTVTRVFDKKTPGANFETMVAFAKGLNFSLDELAGIKPPTENYCLRLIKEKDAKIQQLIEDNQTLREDNKTLREDNQQLRRGKIKFVGILATLIIALIVWLIIDLVNGHFGYFRY